MSSRSDISKSIQDLMSAIKTKAKPESFGTQRNDHTANSGQNQIDSETFGPPTKKQHDTQVLMDQITGKTNYNIDTGDIPASLLSRVEDQDFEIDDDVINNTMKIEAMKSSEDRKKQQEESLNAIGGFLSNPAGSLFDKDGILDPNNMPIIGQTDKDRELARIEQEYRDQNPMPEGAMDDFRNKTSQEWIDIYNKYFDSKGGLDDSYESAFEAMTTPQKGSGEMVMSANGLVESTTPTSGANSFMDSIQKLADESEDNGTNAKENRKALNMSGEEYINYRNFGIPGRAIEDIDPDATYNKLEEMRTYNFVPYIEDDAQRDLWNAQQIGVTGSNAFNRLANTREDWTDATIDYNGDDISYDRLYQFLDDYIRNSRVDDSNIVQTSDPNDPRVSEYAIPLRKYWEVQIDGSPDPERITSSADPSIEWVPTEDGSDYELMVTWPDVNDAYYFADEEELYSSLGQGLEHADDGDSISAYANIDPLSYTQYDGKEVTIPYEDAIKLANGEFNRDYGLLNMAKPAADLSNLTEWNFTDWIPKLTDMGLGSAPLWFNKIAWPMSISNAMAATTGLDANSYDEEANSYKRISDDVTADQYLANIGLSALVPMTERFAGSLGPGGKGLMSKPIKEFMKKKDINPLLSYPVEAIGGEGFEEALAGSWEEIQSMGLDEAFGNEIGYDSTGHAIKDKNTPAIDRWNNYLKTIPENFVAGAALGSTMGSVGALRDAKSNTGAFGEARARKQLMDLEKELGLPRYRYTKNENNEFELTPEILKEYRRD